MITVGEDSKEVMMMRHTEWEAAHDERRKKHREIKEVLEKEEKRLKIFVIVVAVFALLLKGGILVGIGYVVYLLLRHFGVI